MLFILLGRLFPVLLSPLVVLGPAATSPGKPSLAPQMGSMRHSSDSLKLLSQELREVKSALTGSRVLNPSKHTQKGVVHGEPATSPSKNQGLGSGARTRGCQCTLAGSVMVKQLASAQRSPGE